ncbi:MAG: Ribosomal RNA small subunit methyltransferase D [Syntrophus sp. PtaU1.Bin208]|nr:MAG: Ribosomal RNA small subunit methyltransferase D [Syntrophus sp. PtaU1.Bin208]
MRIIGGQARGRRIAVPPGYAVRPTSDRIKEALFNILGPLDGRNFLDLYAGTGNVGLEALSRGAAEVVFVEKISALITALRNNLDAFGFSGRYEVIATDVEQAINRLVQKGKSFDLIFADPPYRKGQIERTIVLLNGHPSLLAKEGMLILQNAQAEPLEIKADKALKLVDERRYGDTLLSFMKSN